MMDFFKLDPMFDTRLFKDIYLGFCSFVIFTTFNVFTGIQIHIESNIKKDNPSFHLDDVIFTIIFYATLFFCTLLSSGIIAKTGSKFAIMIGTVFKFLNMAAYFTTQSIWFYLGAATSGFGDVLLWIALANYLVLNSEIGKVYFGIGIFWIFYQLSYLFSRIIVHFKFNNFDVPYEILIDRAVRSLYTVTGFAIMGILMLAGVKPPLRSEDEKEIVRSPCNEILKTCKLLITPRMLLLAVTIITIGFDTLFTSYLSTRILFSVHASTNPRNLSLYCAIVQVFGGIFGGAFSIAVGGKRISGYRSLISLALVCNLIYYLVALLALPNGAVRFYTDDLPIVALPSWILMIGAALSGVGEAFLYTSIYDLLGAMYPNESASAFAVFKFIRNNAIAASSSKYYGWYFGLHIQIVVLMVLIVLSWLLYNLVDDRFVIKTTSVSENQTELRTVHNSDYL